MNYPNLNVRIDQLQLMSLLPLPFYLLKILHSFFSDNLCIVDRIADTNFLDI
ncbi:MAG: hypothetical protein WC649_10330 [Desulfobacteria bacterium]